MKTNLFQTGYQAGRFCTAQITTKTHLDWQELVKFAAAVMDKQTITQHGTSVCGQSNPDVSGIKF